MKLSQIWLLLGHYINRSNLLSAIATSNYPISDALCYGGNCGYYVTAGILWDIFTDLDGMQYNVITSCKLLKGSMSLTVSFNFVARPWASNRTVCFQNGLILGGRDKYCWTTHAHILFEWLHCTCVQNLSYLEVLWAVEAKAALIEEADNRKGGKFKWHGLEIDLAVTVIELMM